MLKNISELSKPELNNLLNEKGELYWFFVGEAVDEISNEFRHDPLLKDIVTVYNDKAVINLVPEQITPEKLEMYYFTDRISNELREDIYNLTEAFNRECGLYLDDARERYARAFGTNAGFNPEKMDLSSIYNKYISDCKVLGKRLIDELQTEVDYVYCSYMSRDAMINEIKTANWDDIYQYDTNTGKVVCPGRLPSLSELSGPQINELIDKCPDLKKELRHACVESAERFFKSGKNKELGQYVVVDDYTATFIVPEEDFTLNDILKLENSYYLSDETRSNITFLKRKIEKENGCSDYFRADVVKLSYEICEDLQTYCVENYNKNVNKNVMLSFAKSPEFDYLKVFDGKIIDTKNNRELKIEDKEEKKVLRHQIRIKNFSYEDKLLSKLSNKEIDKTRDCVER